MADEARFDAKTTLFGTFPEQGQGEVTIEFDAAKPRPWLNWEMYRQIYFCILALPKINYPTLVAHLKPPK